MEEAKVVLSKEEYDALKRQIEYWEYSTKVARQELFEERKETAERFAERLISEFKEEDFWCDFVAWKIDEICKEIVEGRE